MNKCCDNCNEFVKINKNRCYGVCTRFNFVFILWELDSRNNVCDDWKEVLLDEGSEDE